MERHTGDARGSDGRQLGRFADLYEPVDVDVHPCVPQYALPLQKGDICNADAPIPESAWPSLLRNGFAVVPSDWGPGMTDICEYLEFRDIPVFVTADLFLHLYHVQYDATLRLIEERDLYPRMTALSARLLSRCEADQDRYDGDLKEAAQRNVAYLSVGLSLLVGHVTGPACVRDKVGAELELIRAHMGLAPSPIFGYAEDYSAYVPRGHYTMSDALSRYFRAMTWYGRMVMLLEGESETAAGLVSEAEARIQTLQAALLVRHLHGSDDPSLADDWHRVHDVTAFFVGLADDLTPPDYAEALRSACGPPAEWTKLTDPGSMAALRSALADSPHPRIHGGTGGVDRQPPFSEEDLAEVRAASHGLRLMGQRRLPDAEILQQLAAPSVGAYTEDGRPFTLGSGTRAFPRALDVMAALGSQRAFDIMRSEGDTAYEGYVETLDDLRAELAGLPERAWSQSLYWTWLHALKALIDPPGEGYPTFMQTQAWRDRCLYVALASWTELRHDTILYAKYYGEGMAAPGEEPPPGYIEPVPQFYARILALTRMTARGLETLDALDPASAERLQRLEDALKQVIEISLRELRNETLSREERDFIDRVAGTLASAIEATGGTDYQMPVVADVHADGSSGQVLEEAVGEAQLLVACYRLPDGRIAVGAGPSYSHYEFKQPAAMRLTDEDWRDMLAQERAPAPAEWTASFLNASEA